MFNLSAALHELAANAIKHGSLSRPKGQLDLRWSVERTQRGMTLTLDWVEKNGPPARRPRKVGFGSRLIDLVIVRQLNGEVTRSFSRKGLAVKLVVPLTHERWPSPPPPATGRAATRPQSVKSLKWRPPPAEEKTRERTSGRLSIGGLAPAWRARPCRTALRTSERRAAFLVLHGFGSNCESGNVLQPARVLGEFGYVTLRFDMRGCGNSEGEFGRVICLEQVEDLGNALTFLAGHPAVDAGRIGVIGSSFGGAVAVYAGGTNPRVAAVVSNGGWGHGERKFRGQHRDPARLGRNSPKCSTMAAPPAPAPASR